ncbi:AIDA repeat-containing protein [Burkholderia sp. WSM2232]|uniref:AIDA repeat-containing protein n=1 Tax=Burkholderia sp. WSM2232 TaxID=944436 RepID=UPI0018DE44D4
MSGTNASGTFSISNNTAHSVLLENGGSLSVLNGGGYVDTLATSGGRQLVYGLANDTTITNAG